MMIAEAMSTQALQRMFVFEVVCGCVGMILLYVSLSGPGLQLSTGKPLTIFGESIDASTVVENASFYRTQGRIQQSRLANIKRVCSELKMYDNVSYYGGQPVKYYFTPVYQFAICKVPKSGSTFWTQAFNVFKYGKKNHDQIFGSERYMIHDRSGPFHVQFKNVKNKKMRTIVVSRDPYTRLFSAYVDKMHLPLFFKERYKMYPNNKTPQCPKYVSFQTFLDYIVYSVKNGYILNRHWAPVGSLCKPCDVNVNLLVKQETFSDDVKNAMDTFNVRPAQREILSDALHGNRIQYTIPGVVGETLYLINKTDNNATDCLTNVEIAELIWSAFQLQGFIHNNVSFPTAISDVNMISKNMSSLSGVILDTIRAHPMTSSEQKKQRREALVTAYELVRKETLREIRDIYKLDFDMFGYSSKPPT